MGRRVERRGTGRRGSAVALTVGPDGPLLGR
jgi:hypothetical protein